MREHVPEVCYLHQQEQSGIAALPCTDRSTKRALQISISSRSKSVINHDSENNDKSKEEQQQDAKQSNSDCYGHGDHTPRENPHSVM